MSTRLASLLHDLANQIERIAIVYLYEARFDAALNLLTDQVLDSLKDENLLEEWGRLQNRRAETLRYRGYCDCDPAQYDEAIDTLQRVLGVVETLGDEALLADTVDLTGSVLQSKEGSLDASFETRLGYFGRALEIRTEIQDERGIAASNFHIGLVYQNKRPASEDSIQQAFEAFERSYAVASEGEFAFEKAHAARHLAYIYDRRKEPEKAYKLHREFLETNEKIGFKPYLSPAHVMVGLAHFRRGELDEAEQYLQSAYEVADEIQSDHFLADAAMMLGVVSRARGENEKAKEFLEEALFLAEPINLSRVVKVANREIEKLSGEDNSG
jgi:tetratricopeptide (TPR) repeat protein